MVPCSDKGVWQLSYMKRKIQHSLEPKLEPKWIEPRLLEPKWLEPK